MSGRLIFDHPAIRVWTDEPVISLGPDGCIIGHLFVRGPPSRRVSRLDHEALEKLRESDGRSLLTDYWGGYMMVRIDAAGKVSILRDPSGTLPCYLKREAGCVSLSDDITKLASPGMTSVNYEEVARLLGSMDATGRSTCITGVDELIAGECLSAAHGSIAIETWWSPWDYVRPLSGLSNAQAATQLRDVVLDAVGAWASCFENILLGVSGGLDSSIVAAAVHRRTSHLSCLTLVGPDTEGDERRYARALTKALDLPLREFRYELDDIEIGRAVAPHHPLPNAAYFKQAIEAIHNHLQQDTQIDAHFSGNGGDGIFCSMRSALPFLDHFLVEGPRPALARTLRNLSDLTGSDAATVLRHAWNKYRHLDRKHKVRYDFYGLSAAAAARIRSADRLHPWLSAPDDSLPGKATHIAFLMRSHRSLELYPRATHPPHIAPLLAQPIVELCLSIPTWMWIEGGANRAIARTAFQDLLPETILRRAHKGGPGGFSLSIYQRHSSALRDMLSGGRLAASGIVDPSILDEDEDPSWHGTERVQRLLIFAAAESWARWWSEPSN